VNNIIRITREIIANGLMHLALFRNWRVRRGRTTSTNNYQQVQSILSQFHFFIESLGWGYVRDKKVIEIGPGDAIPLGLLFLGAGARQYVAIDRFLGNVWSVSAKRLYRDLIELAPERLCQGWQKNGLDPYQYPWRGSIDSFSRIKLIPKSIEEADLNESGRGDIIISFNVLEHLSNVKQAFRNLKDLLNPGGVMIHRVDYGPHAFGFKNPLMFLALPNKVWTLMGSHRGWPNRMRHSQILGALKAIGFNNTDRITHCFNLKDVKSIHPFLSSEFQRLDEDDLLVADAEIYSSLNTYPVLRGRGFQANAEDYLWTRRSHQ
jgi:SAM-dependent methyltransferase